MAGLAGSPILGTILAMVLFTIGFGGAGGGFGAAIIGEPLGILAAGLILGWIQAGVLYRLGSDAGWTDHVRWPWIALTAAGWIAALVAGWELPPIIGSLMPGVADTTAARLAASLITWAIMGAILGGAQWLVLQAHLRHAGAWVAACTAGTAGGGILFNGMLLLTTGYATPLLGTSIGTFVVAAGAGAAVLGLVTGLTLRRLLGVPALRPHPSA
jgi:hypothetical protein